MFKQFDSPETAIADGYRFSPRFLEGDYLSAARFPVD